MNSIFNQGGKGSTGISANKQSIARVFNVKQNEVAYLEVGSPVTGYQILYDKATQTCWLNTATGTVVSWDIVDASMTLVTSTGSYTLVQGVSNYNLGYGVEGQDIVGQTEARIAALATTLSVSARGISRTDISISDTTAIQTAVTPCASTRTKTVRCIWPR